MKKGLTKKPKISKLIIDLPSELHRNFKAMTSANGISMKEVVESLIEQYTQNKVTHIKKS